jgi:hypothetical protein
LLNIPKSPATTVPISDNQSESSSDNNENGRDTLTDYELDAIKAADAKSKVIALRRPKKHSG